MIVVCIAQDGLTVDGHAGYAETGKDIICAAVSALSQTLIRSMQALTEDEIDLEMAHGHINIRYKNLSECGKLLVDSFFIGISGIANAYGNEYVRIEQHGAARALNGIRTGGYLQ